jgi:hypothetical protein
MQCAFFRVPHEVAPELQVQVELQVEVQVELEVGPAGVL